jgi:hypothetical protein
MTPDTTPIVQTHDHVCLIYYGDTSRQPVVIQWVREGLSEGEGVVLIEPSATAEALIGLAGEDAAERVVVVEPDALYGSGGDGAIAERLFHAATSSDGHRAPTARISSPAAYGLALHDVRTHLEHERAFARAVDRHPIAMLCQYDQVSIDDDVVAQAAAEHEIVVQLDDVALATLDLRPTAEGVRVSGEIDIANHEVVRSWMSRYRGRPLAVDCSNLTFLDLPGLRALTAYATEDAPASLEHLNGEPATLVSALPVGTMPGHVAVGRASG